MTEEEQESIKTIKSLKKARWYSHAFDNGTEILDEEEKKDIDVVLNLISKLQADIELKNETISKAIGHIETCKTSMGNYILSPNETEYLLEILKGETENDTKNK